MSRGRPLQNCNTKRHRQTDRQIDRHTCVCMCARAIASLSLSLSLSRARARARALSRSAYGLYTSANSLYAYYFCLFSPHRPSPTHLSQSGGTFSIDMWLDTALSASFFRF
jgi:hypothetical protein